MKRIVLVVLLVASASFVPTPTRVAAGDLHKRITKEVQPREASEPFEVFVTKKVTIKYSGGPVFIAADKEGTEDTEVDDRLDVTVIQPDGAVDFYTNDYSAGCTSGITPLAPVDISSRFAVGKNRVTVELMDVGCPGNTVRSTAIWLT